MFSRSQQTVNQAPQLQAADVAQNTGVVSLLVALFGFYVVGLATAALNDKRKKQSLLRALWRSDNIQQLVSRLVTTELFADHHIEYNNDVGRKHLLQQCDDVEQTADQTAQRMSIGRNAEIDPNESCLRVLQAEARPRTIYQEWWIGLRT